MTLLDRAIKAQGGDEKLSKAQGATFNTKGTIEVENMKGEVTGDVAVQGEDHIRWNATFSAMGRMDSGTIVVTPEKIWGKGGNREAEEAPKEIAFIRDVFRTIRLSQNLTALRNKEVMVSHLGEVKIDNRAAVGLKVTTKGRPDIDLFFDKETFSAPSPPKYASPNPCRPTKSSMPSISPTTRMSTGSSNIAR